MDVKRSTFDANWDATFGPAVEIPAPEDVVHHGADDRRKRQRDRRADDPRRAVHRHGSGRRTGVPDRRKGNP
jgi:hypothetical protein